MISGDKGLTHVAPQGILENPCLSLQSWGGYQLWQGASTAFTFSETGLCPTTEEFNAIFNN